MAIAKSGLLRGLKGKTAGLVMSQTKQGTVVREYKDSITNPRTPAQQTNRNVFKQAVLQSSAVKNNILQMYGTSRMPSYSKLVSMIMRNAGAIIDGSYQKMAQTDILEMENQIGVNNGDIGPFDLKYAAIVQRANSENVTFEIGYLAPGAAGQTVYFGSDYAISSLEVTLVSLSGLLTFSFSVSFADKIQSENISSKNVGFFANQSDVGNGWNYHYSIPAGQFFAQHPAFEITKSSNPSFFINDAVIPQYGYGRRNYFYCTALVTANVQNSAVSSKKGCLFVSSKNFCLPLTAVSGS